MNDDERQLVEAMHGKTVENCRENQERQPAFVEALHREALEQFRKRPVPPVGPPTVHYTELTDFPPESPIYLEWKTYRRELPGLLSQGQEGKFALIKGAKIVGIFETWDEGLRVGRERYLLQPFLVQPIREREPLLRLRGYSLPCRS